MPHLDFCRVIPARADLLFFIDGRACCVPNDSILLPDDDDSLADYGRVWTTSPVKARRRQETACHA